MCVRVRACLCVCVRVCVSARHRRRAAGTAEPKIIPSSRERPLPLPLASTATAVKRAAPDSNWRWQTRDSVSWGEGVRAGSGAIEPWSLAFRSPCPKVDSLTEHQRPPPPPPLKETGQIP